VVTTSRDRPLWWIFSTVWSCSAKFTTVRLSSARLAAGGAHGTLGTSDVVQNSPCFETNVGTACEAAGTIFTQNAHHVAWKPYAIARNTVQAPRRVREGRKSSRPYTKPRALGGGRPGLGPISRRRKDRMQLLQQIMCQRHKHVVESARFGPSVSGSVQGSGS
jgi:hypothetical protein